jgi:hypothetical protein
MAAKYCVKIFVASALEIGSPPTGISVKKLIVSIKVWTSGDTLRSGST